MSSPASHVPVGPARREDVSVPARRPGTSVPARGGRVSSHSRREHSGYSRGRRYNSDAGAVGAGLTGAVVGLGAGAAIGTMLSPSKGFAHNRKVAIGTGIGAIVALVAAIALTIFFPPVAFVAWAAFLGLSVACGIHAVRAAQDYSAEKSAESEGI